MTAHEQAPVPQDQQTPSRNWFKRFWHNLVTAKPEDHEHEHASAMKEERLRRNPTRALDAATISEQEVQERLKRLHSQERNDYRNNRIRELARQIMANQLPGFVNHEQHNKLTAQEAVKRAIEIYDLVADCHTN